MCATLAPGQDKPIHEFRNEKNGAIIVNVKVLESDPDEDMVVTLHNSDGENGGGATKLPRLAVTAGFWQIPAKLHSGTLFGMVPAPAPAQNVVSGIYI